MKISWRWVVVAVVFLAGLAAAAMPVVNGMQAERVFKEQVALLDAELDAAIGPPARAAVGVYERGLYSTRTQTLITLPESALPRPWRRAMKLPDGPVEFMLDQTLRHGITGIHFSGFLRPQGAAAALIDHLGGNDESIRLQGDIGLNTQTLVLETDRLSGMIDSLQEITLTLEPIRFTADYGSSDERLTTALQWPGLLIQSERDQAAVRAEGLSAGMDGQLVAGTIFDGVWTGQSRFSLDLARVEQPSAQPLELTDFVMQGSSELTQTGQMAGELAVDWQALLIPELPTTRGEFALSIAGVEPEALLAFSRLAQAMETGSVEGEAVQSAMADLLANGASLGLSGLRIESVAGQGLSASAEMVVDPRLAEQLRAGVTGMPLLRSLELEAQAGVDAALVDVLPMEQQLWARQLEGFGILRRDEGQLRARANLSGGALSINGQTWWDVSR